MPTSAIALPLNTSAYHQASLKPSACCRRSRHLENITNATYGVDQLLIEALVDLLAQPEHQHIDDVGPRIEAVVPHVREDHRLRHDPPGVAHQVFEQRKLTRAERLERAPS